MKLPTNVKRIVVETEEEQKRIIKLIHEKAHLGKKYIARQPCTVYNSYWIALHKATSTHILVSDPPSF